MLTFVRLFQLDENVVAIASTKGVFEVDVDASIFYLKNFESADSFGDESPTSPRKIGPEFSSLTRNKSASMKVLGELTLRSRDLSPLKPNPPFFCQADVDTGLRLKRNIPGVSCVEPHPTLNYCKRLLIWASSHGSNCHFYLSQILLEYRSKPQKRIRPTSPFISSGNLTR